MMHIGGMNLSNYFYTCNRLVVLMWACAAVFVPLCAQDGVGGSAFGRFTDEPFVFDRKDDEADSGSATSLFEWDADETDAGSASNGETAADRSAVPPTPAAAEATSTEQAGGAAEQGTAENGTGANTPRHEFFFRSTHSLRKGHGFAAGVAGRGYVGSLQLESPMPMPYFELAARNFGIGLYPLAALQSVFPQKNIPTLFLGAGSLTFGSFLNTANFTGYSKITTGYGGLKLPRQNFIGIGGTQKPVQYGVELYGGGWNGAFFASPEPKHQRMRYGLLGSWQMTRKQTGINMNLQYLTAFIPDVSGMSSTGKQTKTTKSVKSGAKAADMQSATASAVASDMTETNGDAGRQRYHKLFGLSFMFMHPIVSFETTGLCSYAADKTVSGGAQAECDIWYRYAGIRTGAAYTAANAVSWDDVLQTQQVSAFMQPYFKVGMVSLHTLYTFNMKEAERLHTGGAIIRVKHTVVRWSAGWDYRKDLHTAKTTLSCVSSPAWFKGIRWFESAAIGSSVELQHKAINPFIVKKYTVRAGCDFCITQGVFCGISGALSQTIRDASDANTEYVMPVFQPPVCSSALFLRFKREEIGKIHSGKLELTVKNAKPYFDVKIGYQVHIR